jgi:hypothetical protein
MKKELPKFNLCALRLVATTVRETWSKGESRVIRQ